MKTAIKYLDDMSKSDIDTLILGCTHYSIMKEVILSCFNRKINLITSANSINSTIKKNLDKNNLFNSPNKTVDKYYVTDLGQNFQNQAEKLLNSKLTKIEYINPL